ncbi:MAG: thiamine diphosphokinase [Bacteroidetes bacterium 4572_112]|nr:MAG: thiamine diphosphokinase [Bacteroidetes bacterium 4572_112]
MDSNSTIILANGTFPQTDKLLSILDSAKQIICCDGAVNKLVASGREPSVIIGDLDSADENIKQQYSDKLIHIKDQYTNDLTKAVNWSLAQGIKSLIIMGATGEREDHTIANIALLSKLLSFLFLVLSSNLPPLRSLVY